MVINIALRFLLEVCALAALSYWGFQNGRGIFFKVSLGIGTPLLAAIVWGVFGSPAAPIPVTGLVRLLLEIIINGLAALALYNVGHPILALIFAVSAALNRILMHLWDQ